MRTTHGALELRRVRYCGCRRVTTQSRFGDHPVKQLQRNPLNRSDCLLPIAGLFRVRSQTTAKRIRRCGASIAVEQARRLSSGIFGEYRPTCRRATLSEFRRRCTLPGEHRLGRRSRGRRHRHPLVFHLELLPFFRADRIWCHAEQEESLAPVKDNDVVGFFTVGIEERSGTIRIDCVASVRREIGPV